MSESSPLRAELEFRRKHEPDRLLYKFLERWGQSFRPTARPKGFKRGRPKQCYANAAALAQGRLNESRRVPYLYAEGLAFRPRGILFEHAWCVRGAAAIDPTLDDVENYEFLGIVLPNRLLALWQLEFKTYDLLTYPNGQEIMRRWEAAAGDVHNLIKRQGK